VVISSFAAHHRRAAVMLGAGALLVLSVFGPPSWGGAATPAPTLSTQLTAYSLDCPTAPGQQAIESATFSDFFGPAATSVPAVKYDFHCPPPRAERH
jgi:hypothetical protein